jgi:hydrogenase expression/formation protein HypC
MCLAVPGRILSIETKEGALTMGKVDFGGVVKEICLAYVPDARIGDYAIVHVGFAINLVDEAEAQKTFEYLQELGELS